MVVSPATRASSRGRSPRFGSWLSRPLSGAAPLPLPSPPGRRGERVVMVRREHSPGYFRLAARGGQAAVLGAAGEEAAQCLEQLRLVQQEGVVALVGLDLDETDVGGDSIERVHDLAALGGREQPVASERDDAEARPGALERSGQRAAMLLR